MSSENINQDTNQQTSLMARLGSVQVGKRGIVLDNMDDIFRFAKAVHMSQLCPPGFSETDCFVIIANGLEVGMSPMAALASTYVVNNRAAIFGDMPLALVRQSGLLEDYQQEYTGKAFDDDFACVVTTKRKGESRPLVTVYSVGDAKLAELWGKTITKNGKEFKTPWLTAPRRMLLFRARGFNLRDGFGDILKGCAIAELDDRFGEPGFAEAKVAEGKVVEPRFQPTPEMTPVKPPAELPGIIVNAGPPEKTEIAEPVKRPRGRPRKEESQPAAPSDVSAAPTAKDETNPAAPPIRPPSPPQAPPAAPPVGMPSQSQPVNLTAAHTEILKRLDEDKMSRQGFLLRMHHYDFGAQTEEEIRAGKFTISDLTEEECAIALKNWAQLTAPLERLGP
jgi:hypothetical protein